MRFQLEKFQITWSNLYLLSHLENSPENRTSGHSSSQLLHLTTRLVHVEAPDNDEPRLAGKISNGYRDILGDVFTHHLDVVLELGGDGDDGCSLSYSTFDKLQDLIMLLQSLK